MDLIKCYYCSEYVPPLLVIIENGVYCCLLCYRTKPRCIYCGSIVELSLSNICLNCINIYKDLEE